MVPKLRMVCLLSITHLIDVAFQWFFHSVQMFVEQFYSAIVCVLKRPRNGHKNRRKFLHTHRSKVNEW